MPLTPAAQEQTYLSETGAAEEKVPDGAVPRDAVAIHDELVLQIDRARGPRAERGEDLSGRLGLAERAVSALELREVEREAVRDVSRPRRVPPIRLVDHRFPRVPAARVDDLEPLLAEVEPHVLLRRDELSTRGGTPRGGRRFKELGREVAPGIGPSVDTALEERGVGARRLEEPEEECGVGRNGVRASPAADDPPAAGEAQGPEDLVGSVGFGERGEWERHGARDVPSGIRAGITRVDDDGSSVREVIGEPRRVDRDVGVDRIGCRPLFPPGPLRARAHGSRRQHERGERDRERRCRHSPVPRGR